MNNERGHRVVSADTIAVYQASRIAREAGQLTHERVFLTQRPRLRFLQRHGTPTAFMPRARPDLYPSFREIIPTSSVGTLGLRYVEKVRDTEERRFWLDILAYLLGERPFDDGKNELAVINRASTWEPPGWIQGGRWDADYDPPRFVRGRQMFAYANCVVLPGLHQERALAYWSLHMAAIAERLRRCRRCRNVFLAVHSRDRTCKPCRSHPRPPGRPKVPGSCAKHSRRFQNRVYQWQARRVIDQRAVQVLIAAMKTDLEAVRNQRQTADRFSTTWQRNLTTWRKAKAVAVQLHEVAPVSWRVNP